MSFDLELKGRRALVTAGTRGVGAAVVVALREAGVRVVATARTTPEDIDGVRYVAADVTTAEGAARVAREALEHLGGGRHPGQRARWLERAGGWLRCARR